MDGRHINRRKQAAFLILNPSSLVSVDGTLQTLTTDRELIMVSLRTPFHLDIEYKI